MPAIFHQDQNKLESQPSKKKKIKASVYNRVVLTHEWRKTTYD
jgi:hypothetical protein